jgi:predicted aspartyl protease
MTRLSMTRRMLLGAAPALAMVGTAAAQGTGLAMIPSTDQAIDLPLDPWLDAYGRPTAKVMLNGKGPFRFLVDTGSTTTVIAQRHIEGLGFPLVGVATVNGTTGAALTPVTEVDLLEAGVVKRERIRLAVLPDYGLAREDGILGADVFAGRKVVFRIAEKTVRIESSHRSHAISRANIRIRNGLLAEVEGAVGAVRTRLMLDTGAQNCIANMALSDALKKTYPRLARVDNVRVIGVTGHVIYGQYIVLPKVDAKAFSVKDAGAVAADAPIFKLWGLEREPALIVGVNLLSRLASFSIDYGARRFDAELAALIARNSAMMG